MIKNILQKCEHTITSLFLKRGVFIKEINFLFAASQKPNYLFLSGAEQNYLWCQEAYAGEDWDP